MNWNRKRNRQTEVFNGTHLFRLASLSTKDILKTFTSDLMGLSNEQAEERMEKYGANKIIHEEKPRGIVLFCKAFINPFIGVLTILAIISLIIDVWMATPGEKDWTGPFIIVTMVFISAVLRFWQDMKASCASAKLMSMVKNTCTIKRADAKSEKEIDIAEIVPGDIIYLSAGDMIPADVRIIENKDLFLSQSALTGESEPCEKTSAPVHTSKSAPSFLDLTNMCYMGTTVVSGSAKAVVAATGNNTYLGTMAKTMTGTRAQTSFDKGVTKVSVLLIRFMLIMVPFVFLINGITKGEWFQAFIFAVSVAVGLTPEILPMIVTATLSKGAVNMSKKRVIVKNLNAIQNFGAMNILCTDKTGTLTCDNIVLEKYICADGSNDTKHRILRYAFLNSFFQTGLKSLMDKAILNHSHEKGMEIFVEQYHKIDEIPFDFNRRRMSVVIKHVKGDKRIVTKGAVEEILNCCTKVEMEGLLLDMTEETRLKALRITEELNHEGLRVIALAKKDYYGNEREFSVSDESEMILIGYLAFLDPPKPSAMAAINQLQTNGISVKILSGDNDAIVKSVARQIGLSHIDSLSGTQIEAMSDEELSKLIEKTILFPKLTPLAKARIIRLLQEKGNTVGFMGDGINDAAALRQSDVGISVDSGVDIAKESADIILLEKDLMVLEDGVVEGRRTFGNMMKYIKITTSSNFGNMFSVLTASAFLPFLPMLPIHLLIQNLLYDISQIAIPFDHLDKEYLQIPRKWNATDLSRFMLCIGPISSIFDIATYLVMWYVFGCNNPSHQSLFQSGWFVEGLLSQILIVHMIRTRHIPFIHSRASWPVVCLSVGIMIIGICLPFSPIGHSIGFTPLPRSYFFWLICILTSYALFMQFIKNLYIKKFNSWL